MKKDDEFKYLSNCSFAIVSQEMDLKNISKLLNIKPTLFYSKGDKFISGPNNLIAKRFQSLWRIESKPLISDFENFSHHILYFKKLFKNKMKIIEELKNNPNCELVYWFSLDTNNKAVIGFGFNKDEFDFIYSISNRISYTIKPLSKYFKI